MIVGLFHDVGKLTDGFGVPYYSENILKSGKRSDAKPWVTNSKESLGLGVGAKSLLMVSNFVGLYAEEAQAKLSSELTVLGGMRISKPLKRRSRVRRFGVRFRVVFAAFVSCIRN